MAKRKNITTTQLALMTAAAVISLRGLPMMAQEELKTLPFGAVWEEYCRQCGVPENEGWFQTVEKYEADVLKGRN